jgi:nicotinamide-nucleotide amidase
MTHAIILSIGDELVLGQTVDTNSAWLSRELSAIGLRVAAHATVSDDQPAIEEAIRSAAARCDVLLISGGLGPTEDDLTRQALAAVLNQPLELYEEAFAKLSNWFASLKRTMSPSNKIQAMLPRGTRMIENTVGTAPGIAAMYQTGDEKRSCQIFVMPGVPKEMKQMFTLGILPQIRSVGGGAAILSRTLHTFGVGESLVGERLGDLMRRGRNPSVGTTVAGGIVSVRINAFADSPEEANCQLDETSKACRAALGDLVYGEDDQTLASVVADLLKSSNKTVTTAESCTGGLLAKMLTDIPGSSAYFTHGFVTYANEAKTELVGVPAALIAEHGAVSEPVALAMATGAFKRARADFALAISGIAGPTGGTPQKPVGTVCIALARADGQSARTFLFPGDREFIRDRSAKMALALLRLHLLGKKASF